MAKLCLIFLVVFIVVQLTFASRVVRDAPTTESESAKAIESAFDTIKKGLEDTFSKDNIDKMLTQLSDVGEKLKAVGHDIAQKVQEKTAEITKKD